MVELGLKKATSYKVVKGRLGNRMYSDEFLQDRIQYEAEKKRKTVNG